MEVLTLGNCTLSIGYDLTAKGLICSRFFLIGTVDLPTSGQKIVLVGICEISGRNLDAV